MSDPDLDEVLASAKRGSKARRSGGDGGGGKRRASDQGGGRAPKRRGSEGGGGGGGAEDSDDFKKAMLAQLLAARRNSGGHAAGGGGGSGSATGARLGGRLSSGGGGGGGGGAPLRRQPSVSDEVLRRRAVEGFKQGLLLALGGGGGGPAAADAEAVAVEVEEALFRAYGAVNDDYKRQARTIAFNLKASRGRGRVGSTGRQASCKAASSAPKPCRGGVPQGPRSWSKRVRLFTPPADMAAHVPARCPTQDAQNPELRSHVLSRQLPAGELAHMSAADMASKVGAGCAALGMRSTPCDCRQSSGPHCQTAVASRPALLPA